MHHRTFLIAASLASIVSLAGLTGCFGAAADSNGNGNSNGSNATNDSSNSSSYQQVDAETAKEIMDTEDDYVILDARTQAEYDEGHIPGAILIPPRHRGDCRRGRTARQGPAHPRILPQRQSQQAGLTNTRGPRLHQCRRVRWHQQLALRGRIAAARRARPAARRARPHPDFTKQNTLKSRWGRGQISLVAPPFPHLPIYSFRVVQFVRCFVSPMTNLSVSSSQLK